MLSLHHSKFITNPGKNIRYEIQFSVSTFVSPYLELKMYIQRERSFFQQSFEVKFYWEGGNKKINK